MKRLYIASGILACLLLGMWFHITRLEKLTTGLTVRLEELDLCIRGEEWDRAEQLVREMESAWEEKSLYLHSTLHHAEIDDVSTSLKEIRAYLSSREDQGECLALTARLKSHLELLLEDERPTLENLL